MSKKAHNRVNMIGNTYNSWTVVSEAYLKGKIVYYNAICNECQKSYVVDGRNLRSGLSKRCTPCGHLHGHDKQKGKIRTKRTAEESSYYYLANDLKKGAIKRKKEWNLTAEQVKALVSSDCIYCGTAPQLVCNHLKWQELSQKNDPGANIIRNGIDRIDSSKGYVPDNVVPCCQTCNKAKLEMSVEEFLNWGKRLYEHNFTG